MVEKAGSFASTDEAKVFIFKKESANYEIPAFVFPSGFVIPKASEQVRELAASL